LSLLAFVASTLLYAQTEITGTVVDEFGEGVIGATVKEKGTSNGTATDKTVSEVAYAVGFTTPSYFTKCFKDEFGQSPTEMKH